MIRFEKLYGAALIEEGMRVGRSLGLSGENLGAQGVNLPGVHLSSGNAMGNQCEGDANGGRHSNQTFSRVTLSG